MKVLYVLLAAGLVAASVAVYSQAGFTVPKRDFIGYQYQIFDVSEPVPASSSAGPLSTNQTAIRIPSRTAGGNPPPPSAPSPFTRTSRNLEILCNELGPKGFRLVQLIPRAGGAQAVFEKEIPPNVKK